MEVPIWERMKITVADSLRDNHIYVWISGPANLTKFIDQTSEGPNFAQIRDQSLITWSEFVDVRVGNLMHCAFDLVWHSEVRPFLYEASQKHCGTKIKFAGHSIGGCMAQMLSMKVIKEKLWARADVSSLAFAAFRCGDENFAATHEYIVPDSIRFSWIRDPFTGLPHYKPNNDYTSKVLTFKPNRQDVDWFHAGDLIYAVRSSSCSSKTDTDCAPSYRETRVSKNGVTTKRNELLDGYIATPNGNEQPTMAQADNHYGFWDNKDPSVLENQKCDQVQRRSQAFALNDVNNDFLSSIFASHFND